MTEAGDKDTLVVRYVMARYPDIQFNHSSRRKMGFVFITISNTFQYRWQLLRSRHLHPSSSIGVLTAMTVYIVSFDDHGLSSDLHTCLARSCCCG